MSCINFNEISSLITKWLQNSSIESLQFTDSKLVEKAIGIVLYPHQDNEDSLFLQLCALNFLNAVIKTEAFKNKLSNDLIKSNAARLIKTVDVLKNDEKIGYNHITKTEMDNNKKLQIIKELEKEL